MVDLALVTDAPSRTGDPSPSAENGIGVNRRALAIGLCVLEVAIAFEVIAVATAMPAAGRDLGGLSSYAWAFSLFMIGMLFSTVISGRMSDRIGPAKPLIGGLVIFAVGLLLAGFAPTWGILITARLVQGLAGGVMNTAMYVTIASLFDSASRPRMFTYLSMAWVLPGVVGPSVSAWITHQFSWHWVFFAVLPLLALGAILIAPNVRLMLRNGRPERPADAAPPAPLWAAGVVAVSAAAIGYAGQRLDYLALAPAAVGVVGLVVGLPKLMPPGFLRLGRGLASVVLCRMFLPGAFFGTEAFIPLMLVEHRGLQLLLAGAVLSIGTVGWSVGAWMQSQRWMTLRRDRLITLGCGSVAFGIALVMLFAFWSGSPLALIGIAWIFAAFGMGVATASTAVAVMEFSPRADQGRNASSLNLGDALGSSLFVGISGSVFTALRGGGDLGFTFGIAFAAMVAVALLAVLASTRIGRLPE